MSAQGRIALGVLVVVALLAGGWFGLVAPKRTQATAVEAQIGQAETRRATALAALADAERLRAEARKETAIVARLNQAVPKDDDVGALIRQLDAVARANHIDFRSMRLVSSGAAPAAPAADTPPPADGEAAGDKKDGKKATGETAPNDTTAAAAGAPVAATVAQPPPGAAVGPAGLLTIPFSFTFDGGYREMQRFLGAINDLASNKNGHITVHGRLVTVDGFTLGAGRRGFPKVKALVSATAYLAPDAPAPTAAPAGAPAAGPIAGAPAAGGGGG